MQNLTQENQDPRNKTFAGNMEKSPIRTRKVRVLEASLIESYQYFQKNVFNSVVNEKLDDDQAAEYTRIRLFDAFMEYNDMVMDLLKNNDEVKSNMDCIELSMGSKIKQDIEWYLRVI